MREKKRSDGTNLYNCVCVCVCIACISWAGKSGGNGDKNGFGIDNNVIYWKGNRVRWNESLICTGADKRPPEFQYSPLPH